MSHNSESLNCGVKRSIKDCIVILAAILLVFIKQDNSTLFFFVKLAQVTLTISRGANSYSQM